MTAEVRKALEAKLEQNARLIERMRKALETDIGYGAARDIKRVIRENIEIEKLLKA